MSAALVIEAAIPLGLAALRAIEAAQAGNVAEAKVILDVARAEYNDAVAGWAALDE